MGVPARSVSAASCPLIRGSLTGILPSATLGLLSSAATASCLRFGDPHVCRPSPRIGVASRVDKRVPSEGTEARNPAYGAKPAHPRTATLFVMAKPDREPGPDRPQVVVRGNFSGPSATWTS